MEKSRRVLGQDGDACLRLQPLGDQAVGDLVGGAVKLGKRDVPALVMDGDAVRTSAGMMAGDVADRSDGRDAFDLAHDPFLPRGFQRCAAGSQRTLLFVRMVGSLGSRWKAECGRSLRG